MRTGEIIQFRDMALICVKHGCEFVERGPSKHYPKSVMRCPECVAQARAKVHLEFHRFRKWHPCKPKVIDGKCCSTNA